MTISEFQNAYCASIATDQKLFLATLASELTIWARNTYEPGTYRVLDSERLREFNELQHRITGQLVQLMRNDDARYPDEVISGTIWQYAMDLKVQEMVEIVWSKLHDLAFQTAVPA